MVPRLRRAHDKTDDSGDPWWWDSTAKRWIGKDERDARIAGVADPYAAPISFADAFGPDLLAPYATALADAPRSREAQQ